MRYPKVLVLAVVAGLFATACDESPTPSAPETAPEEAAVDLTRLAPNPSPDEVGPLPAVELPEVKSFPKASLSMHDGGGGTLTPASVSAVLEPGETITETKTVQLPEAPPAGDVLFMFDLTGSMGGELNTLKTEAVNIMNAVGGVIGDVRFGLISHEDYPDFFDSSAEPGCTYAATYGSAFVGDQAYRLDQVLTSTTADVSTAIGNMTLKAGADGPESYARGLYESVAELTADGADPAFGPLGWRAGAKKIVVAFNDFVPHDCAVDAILGGSTDTGIDPGRDATVGTADDLEILPVLQTMANQDVTLINLHSGAVFNGFFGIPDFDALWQAYAEVTGGTNFSVNADGSFPGGTDPAAEIAALIQAEVSALDELTLDVCPGDEAFADWIVSAETITDVELPSTEELDVELGPPAGTEAGKEFHFQVCAIGDGAVFGRQDVWITTGPIEVDVDIKPGSFPNSINVNKKKGRTPVAVLTTPAFDATTVDPATVTLGDDDGDDTPVASRRNGTLMASPEDVDGDGDVDLILHFETPALVANGDLTPATTELTLNGETFGGVPVKGSDSVRVVP